MEEYKCYDYIKLDEAEGGGVKEEVKEERKNSR